MRASTGVGVPNPKSESTNVRPALRDLRFKLGICHPADPHLQEITRLKGRGRLGEPALGVEEAKVSQRKSLSLLDTRVFLLFHWLTCGR